MSDGPVAVVVLADIAASARLWGLSRYVVGRFSLARQPGLRFFKILGSGEQGGFGLRPSASHMGLFLVFDDDASARRFLDESVVMARWRSRCAELFSVRLRAFSSRGSWAGMALPAAFAAPPTGPVAVLTRASIRPSKAAAFWRRAPATDRALAAAPGCRLAAGLGEAPLLRQATFSLWDDAANVDAYARSGAHGAGGTGRVPRRLVQRVDVHALRAGRCARGVARAAFWLKRCRTADRPRCASTASSSSALASAGWSARCCSPAMGCG